MTSIPTAALVALPATILVMGQTVQATAQASDAMKRDPDDVADRLRKALMVIGGALVVAALVSGDTGTLAVTAVAAGGSYYLFGKLVLS